MVMMETIVRSFVHAEIGAKRARDKFWATDAQAVEFEKAGIAKRVEGKSTPLAYATKVEPWSVQPAAQAFAERTLTIAESEAGPSGQPTAVTSSDATDSTPAITSGGEPTPKRRGRPPSAGHKTKTPAKPLG